MSEAEPLETGGDGGRSAVGEPCRDGPATAGKRTDGSGAGGAGTGGAGIGGAGSAAPACTVPGGHFSGDTVSGGTVSGGTVSGDTVSGGTVSGGTVSGGTVSGSSVSGGSLSGGGEAAPGRAARTGHATRGEGASRGGRGTEAAGEATCGPSRDGAGGGERQDGAEAPGGAKAPGSGVSATLEPGLYLVATPIGAARDITLRALDVLASADALAAEDTRTLRRLMEIHGLSVAGRPLLPYHDHNGAAQRPRLLGLLREGRSLAYCSDAGTPLVADPGFRLAGEAIAAGHAVHAVPGASAALAALTVSGLPTDRFLFAGFAPAQGGPRARFLAEVAAVPATLVLYESGRRVAGLCAELVAEGHGARPAALCRELTKRHEEIRRASLAALADALAGDAAPKGEIVLVLGPPVPRSADEAEVETALRAALDEHPLKRAAAEVAEKLGVSKRDVYQLGLRLKSQQK